jgi:site-specific DNA-methyltransferase (cytosine-N4-specific)
MRTPKNQCVHQPPIEPSTVVTGDAYDLACSLQCESVDLILTSPPYWGQRTYGMNHNWSIADEWTSQESSTVPSYEWYRSHGGVLGLEPTPDWYIAHLVEILTRVARSLKPSGNMWINLGDTYFARWASMREGGRQGLGDNPRQRRRVPMGDYRQEKQLLLVPARFAIAMQSCRWILRNDMIWHKPNVPPRPERDRLRLAHEHFFHFVRRPKEGRAKYYYNPAANEPEGTDVVTYCVRSGSDGHTATFPVALITPRIISSCPPGGTILDPFCGTGRALVVARSHNRMAIGFELSPDYASVARKALASGDCNLTLDLDEMGAARHTVSTKGTETGDCNGCA